MTESSPNIFISYSWTSPDHEDWVLQFAERLISDGIDVKLDKWDLKEGQDIYSFMETMVNSDNIEKVLIISDSGYTYKANNKQGGVGTETQIISPEIYKKVSQEKFLPIVREHDKDEQPYLPTFLQSRLYFDFSRDQHFEDSYEKLLRNIFKRPSKQKPKIGTPPSYLFEETPVKYKISSKIKMLEHAINNNPQRINAIASDFFKEYRVNLKEFSIESDNNQSSERGKKIIDTLTSYIPLRNYFIDFFEKIAEPALNFDTYILTDFLEKCTVLFYPEDGRTSWNYSNYSHFRFIVYELFLYIVTIAISRKNYILATDIIYSTYYPNERDIKTNKTYDFVYFNHELREIDKYYNELYSINFICSTADLLLKKLNKNYTKKQFIQTDILCHYIGTLHDKFWFPSTYIYDRENSYELFYKMSSKKHFERVKILFNVESIEEFQNKLFQLEALTPDNVKYSNSFETVPHIFQVIDQETIGRLR